MRRSILLAVASLLAATAYAGPVISFFAPVRYRVGSAEHFMTIDGNGFLPIEGTTVIFGGGAGTFELLPNAWSETRLDTWVPPEIGRRVGLYTVRVRTKHKGVTEESNSLEFEVYGVPGAILHLPTSNILQQATSKAGANVSFTVSASSPEDGSPLPVSCDHRSGDLYPFGWTTVRCSTTDPGGTTTEGFFAIAVVDFVAPKIHLPADILVPATGPAGANVDYQVSAEDDIDGPLAVNCTPASGSLFPINRNTLVRCDAVDAHFNSAHGEFHVTVGEPPGTLPVPPPITAEATGPGGAVVTFTVSAGPSMAVNCFPASGSLFPLGATTVNCNAAEMFGRFAVTVVDTTPPVLTLPADITSSDPVVTFTASAHDLVDGQVGVTCSPASGSTFPSGTTTVNCSAMDAHGNSAGGSFHVTVNAANADKTPPVVTSISASPDVLSPPNHKLVPVVVSVTAVDDTDPDPISHIVGVTANEPIDVSDWRLTGLLALELRAERNGSADSRIYMIEVRTSDRSGNETVNFVSARVPHDSKGDGLTTQPPPPRRRSAGH